jgi:hypothetical protein
MLTKTIAIRPNFRARARARARARDRDRDRMTAPV